MVNSEGIFSARQTFMKKPYTPFLAFLVLILITIPFSFDFSTSIVPGWHTTIFPAYFIGELIVIIVLLFVIIGYWLLSKQGDKTSWILFAIHFLFTIPTIIYIKFPTVFLDLQIPNQDKQIKAIAFRMHFISAAWILFVLGQILFVIYYIRVQKVKHTISP
ncbi:hypothetical protein DC498_05340 [Terrimonas sp.]|nr:hypothetical protein DC498_05340 [Terrimonas sp.]